MSDLYATVKQFFFDDEWLVTEEPELSVIKSNHYGENGRFACEAEINVEQQIFSFFSYFPVKIPSEKQSVIMEFITRANYGMRSGNFELDLADGELRFRTSIDVENDRLSEALISNMVYSNVWTMDRYLVGFFGLVYDNLSVQEAVEKVE